MALKAEVERRCTIAMQEIFGHDCSVSTTVNGGRVTVTVTGAQIQAGREGDSPALIGAIRDVIRPQFSRSDLLALARQRGETVDAVERHLAADHLRQIDSAPEVA